MQQSAEATFRLDPAPKVITFDCYGTLVQWYEVLLREIGATLMAHQADGRLAQSILDEFSTHSRRLMVESLTGFTKPYCGPASRPPSVPTA